MRAYLGVDVGTGSARAALFDGVGRRLGVGVHPIAIFKPRAELYEHSSEDIWRACGVAVRTALKQASIEASDIVGIGFDATCSLVALDGHDRPVSVSEDGDDSHDTIVWMDHRAVEQAARINATKHRVLQYVGGVISPEMQTPKLLWLKEHLPSTWKRTARFMDLPDFLAFRATGVDVRSLCTTVCKWTHTRDGWDDSYFREVGLGDLVDESYRRIGTRVRPMGEKQGTLSARAAEELGLVAGIAVGVSIIDAHAGGVGLLGAAIEGHTVDEDALSHRLALIGGTSSCHMAVSRDPTFVPGVWGPYYSAMVPGMWLTEGGQSATGALIDHVIASHARGAELVSRSKSEGTTPYAMLNERLHALASEAPFPAALARDLHVLPDHHGNRSPRADPTMRGMICGLSLDDSIDALARIYLATIQAIAHGTKHILDAMRSAGYSIDTIVACGGDTKNPIFVREHADVTSCRVVLPKEPEAVLLGAAILGAVAAGDFSSIVAAMAAMNIADRTVTPNHDIMQFHARKHDVFLRMADDQLAYRTTMGAAK